jgi:hypothetical protein
MYICRKCNTPVDEANRFCAGCGAYIGEPAVKKDNWETANYSENSTIKHAHVEAAAEITEPEVSKNLDRDSNRQLFVRNPQEPTIKSTIIVTALVLFTIPLLLSFIVKSYLTVPNDLIDIILPFRLLERDFKGMLNLPGTLGKAYLFIFLGFAAAVIILFTSLYFSARLTSKTEVYVLRLWKAIMVSFQVYALALAVFLGVSFISRILGNLLLFGGMIFWLFTLYNAVRPAFKGIEDKVAILIIPSFMISYVTVYAYLYCFLR